jgi:transposase InsO family protein
MDNAKMYRSPQLETIAASLGALVIHSRPYQPEGRGKIERCFRTSVIDKQKNGYVVFAVMWSTVRFHPWCAASALMKAT